MESSTRLGTPKPGEKSAMISDIEATPRSSLNKPTAGWTGWKPLSLSKTVLICFIIITLGLAAAIEALAQLSHSRGGLALSISFDHIPRSAMITYLYVPNIIAVLYSLIWNWIDLDVKRLQPWFELSKSNGAAAKDTLFLDYPSQFAALVPFHALRRRHWPVFFSGSTLILIFWVLTPIQSSLLGIGTTTRIEPVNITSRFPLPAPSKQDGLAKGIFLHTAYDVMWLDQPYPAFTTPEYALSPYYIGGGVGVAYPAKNWLAATTKFWAELDCSQYGVALNYTNREQAKYDLTLEKGCSPTSSFFSNDEGKSMLYAMRHRCDPYDISPTSGAIIQVAKPIEKKETKIYFNMTALYCQPSYYKQEVMATVTQDYVPIDDSIQGLSKPVKLTEGEFNATLFATHLEHSNNNEITPSDVDYPYAYPIDIRPKFLMSNITVRWNPMMPAFAFVGRNDSFDDYFDPSKLEAAFRGAYKQLFSLAIASSVTNGSAALNHTATMTVHQTGIVASRVLSAVSEALLLLIALTTAIIIYYCHISPCNLRSNPSSIGRVMEIVHHSAGIKEAFHQTDTADEDALVARFVGTRCQLHGDSLEVASSHKELPTVQKDAYKPVKPFILRRESGVTFAAVLVGFLISLAYLKSKEEQLHGLPRPSTSFEVLQLLENYLPTILATLLEPFWILLTRTLCVIQPFKDMWAGKASPAASVNATYTSVPPQLVFLRAIKSRHFVLALLCAVTLLANVLAVTFGALFNEKSMMASYDQSFQPLYQSRVNLTQESWSSESMSLSLKGHLYITMANMSSGTPLPAWLSPEWYFEPHTIVGVDGMNTSDTFTFSTRGYGADANCSALGPLTISNTFENDEETNANTTCHDLLSRAKGMMAAGFGKVERPDWWRADVKGRAAMNMAFANGVGEYEGTCYREVMVAWGRKPEGSYKTANPTASFALCRPSFRTAMFNVTVDRSGHILKYQQTGKNESDLGYSQSFNGTSWVMYNMMAQRNTIGHLDGYRWTTDTYTRDWMSYLMMLTRGSRDFLDPDRSVPDPKEMLSTIDTVYGRLFAAFLSTNPMLLTAAGDDAPTVWGSRLAPETRIFMDRTAFIISMAVLAIDIAVTVIVFAQRSYFVLPRMPSSIGSIMAYVAPSRAVKHGDRASWWEDKTFSFGRYEGHDGETHVGIEVDPYVVSMDKSMLEEKQSLLGRIFH
ncbi:hypothetical protein B0T10DRAFT_558091 [Thelonectria olida]|uniref:Uncharacterized protein n=1 Tax=Thelonectria olida TaxID=1576542 RepID=A0A9P8WD18_9HYPO|nr:hypothetical protein B0T10DRAFT_558091 [Thelonectria olida]